MYTMKLQELVEIFCGENDKLIRLEIERGGVPMRFVFKLEDPLK